MGGGTVGVEYAATTAAKLSKIAFPIVLARRVCVRTLAGYEGSGVVLVRTVAIVSSLVFGNDDSITVGS